MIAQIQDKGRRCEDMAAMVTTVDNPYDPRTQFPAWYQWDVINGYNTCAYLDRVAHVTDDFPKEYNDRLVEEAIDEMIALHNGMYKKLDSSAA
jgi:hypothetical protein